MVDGQKIRFRWGERERSRDGRITMRLDNRVNASRVSCFGCGESSLDNPDGPGLIGTDYLHIRHSTRVKHLFVLAVLRATM